MPKVYSYTRFSTPEQAQGDSFRRQAEAAARWIARKNAERVADGFAPVTLDETLSLRDLGVSAFRGANTAEDSGLGGFLFACEQGLIDPGSYLLVESLDRISRMTPRRVSRLLDSIVDAGVTIVTLSDGQEYDAHRLDSDPTALLLALMVSWRAHEESKVKGQRVASAWAEKRRRVRAGEVQRLTPKGPSWLQPDGDGWKVDPEKAATVRRVYAMTLDGHGEHNIAETLNRERVAPLGRASRWHRSSVAKLLRNRAVIGELTPGYIEHADGRKRRVTEEPIAGAFPAIISEADWLAVRALKDGSTASARGRSTGRPLANVLAGLARCPLCGSAMTRVYKGSAAKAGRAKLVCTKAKAGAGCEYHSVPLDEVQEALLSKPWFAVRDVPAGRSGGELDREALALENSIAGTEDHLRDLADALAASPSRTGAQRLARLEQEVITMREALADLEERRRLTDHGLVRARAERLYEAIVGREGGALEPINAAMRTLFSGVVVDFTRRELQFQWKQGGTTPVLYGWPGA
jgi:DNA invertase Pin-like site-specific DNA recombinase